MNPPASSPSPPHWSGVLRALREARSLTQDGWAAHLGVGRRTVQRWEQGLAVPDAAARRAILASCDERGLFRRFDAGPLAGITLTPESLGDLLAAAHLDEHAPPLPDVPATTPDAVLGPQSSNLPVPLTSLIGRDQDIEDVARLLERARLVTLTGPGGVGKTRLALAVAERVHGDYPNGVWFVDLTALTDPGLVAATIAQTLTVREGEGQTPADVLRAYLRGKSLLLVLDNFEQVVPAASLLRDLLAACPDLRLLVTSRVVLHVPGEREYAVLPLPLPDPTTSTRLADFIDNPAVALFVERAQSVRPDFVLTEENAGAVAEICRRLDGLPLAIELAAARTKILSPQAMLPRLENRLKLLTGGGTVAPERQQTLRGAIQWSYDLLDDSEQVLFRRLAVFAGGCTLEAAEAVCNAEGDLEILDGLASLVDKSLLRQQDGPDGEPRFTMLATTREFAAELARERGELATSERRHAAYFLTFAAGVEALLEQSPMHRVFGQLNQEQDNVRAALAWAMAHQAAEEGAAALAGMWFWLCLTRPSEGLQWADAFLATPEGTDRSPARANALLTGGAMHLMHGRIRQTRAYLQESASIWREVDVVDQRGLAVALDMLGTWTQPPPEGRPLVEESVQICRQLGQGGLPMVRILGDCASVMLATDDLDAARPLIEEALAIAQQTGDPESIGLARIRQGWLALYEDQPTAAQAQLETALGLFQETGDTFNVVFTQFDLGCAAVLLHDADVAARRFTGLLRLAQEREHIGTLADGLEGLAVVAALGGDATRAARLFGAADTARRTSGGAMRSRYAFLRSYRRRLSEVRDACLGVPGVEAAWEAGRALSLDAAVALALEQAAPDTDVGGVRRESVPRER